MRNRLIPIMIGVAVACSCPPARADEAPRQEMSSKVKIFVIDPEQSAQTFMCDGGEVQSVLATAVADHRVVSIVFVDQSKAPISSGAWSSAYGFRLAHHQSVKVQVAMICGQ